MAILSWSPSAISFTSLATTELNSLANGAGAVSSSVDPQVDNGITDPYTHAIVEITLASLTPTTGGHVVVFLYPKDTGGSYPSSTVAIGAYAGFPYQVIALYAGAAAQQLVSRPFPIFPREFRVGVINRAGVAFASSGNVVKVGLLQEKVV